MIFGTKGLYQRLLRRNEDTPNQSLDLVPKTTFQFGVEGDIQYPSTIASVPAITCPSQG